MSTAAPAPQALAVPSAPELLDHLTREMRRAAKKPDEDAIHDVRVAIRRMRQCLKVFAPAFPSRASKNVDKKLSKLLGAAGDLRNLDISIELLKQARLARTRGLIRAIQEDRKKAEKDFTQAIEKLTDSGITEKWRSKLVVSEPLPDAMDEAPRNLLPTAAEFFDAGELAADPSANPETLHKFRIKAKKFRYTLELFAPIYGPTLESRMRVLRNLQKRLGAINDCVATTRILKKYRIPHATVVDKAAERLAKIVATETANFRRYFHRTLGPKQKAVWIRYLSGAKSGESK